MKDIALFCKYRIKRMVQRPVGFVVPIIFIAAILLCGNLFSPQFHALKNVKIILIDNDNSPESVMLWARLSQSEMLQIENDIQDKDTEAAKNRLVKNQVNAVFVINEGFAENVVVQNNKRNLIQAYYNDYSIAAKFISETIAAEVMRFYVTEKGLHFIEEQAAANGFLLSTEDMQQNRENVEYYWSRGLTFQPNIEWVDPNDDAMQESVLARVVTDCLTAFLIALCIAVQLAFLAEEKERGILARIEALGRSSMCYALCASAVTAAVFLLPLFLLRPGEWLMLLLLAIWMVMAVNLVVALCKKRSTVMQTLPVLFIALTFLAAGCSFFGEQITLLQNVGLLNPFFCLLHPDKTLAAIALLAHSACALVGIWKRTIWRIR